MFLSMTARRYCRRHLAALIRACYCDYCDGGDDDDGDDNDVNLCILIGFKWIHLYL